MTTPSPTSSKTGLEMATAVRAALADAGLPRTSTFNGAEMCGWTRNLGSTGFSLRATEDGQVDWHLVVSGKPHLSYREYEDEVDDETYVLHEPVRPELLFHRIKAVFASLGLEALNVAWTGHSTSWDDDVCFNVLTEHPDWLEREVVRERFRY